MAQTTNRQNSLYDGIHFKWSLWPLGTYRNACSSDIVIMIRLHYLRERGLTTVEPALSPKSEGRTYIPHAFTDEELRRFFCECDRIVPLRPELKYNMKKITCPVFFRLLYSSGIRTTEARYLKKEDVDLEHGVLNIKRIWPALCSSPWKHDRAFETIRQSGWVHSPGSYLLFWDP